MHDDDQPSHLRIKAGQENIPSDLSWKTFAAPEQRFCPAKVYEYVEDEDKPGEAKLQSWAAVGLAVGAAVGLAVGAAVGDAVGAAVGLAVISMQLLAPAFENLPAGQSVQLLVPYLPAGHGAGVGAGVVQLLAAKIVLPGQSLQTASPVLSWYWPAGQFIHVPDVLYLPAAQS